MPTPTTKNRIVLPAVGAACCIAGFLVGFAYRGGGDGRLELVKLHPASSSKFAFVRPLLGCDVRSEGKSEILEDVEVERKVVAAIEASRGAGDIETASVYYRDLENGAWVGVNEHETFTPASLFKLPVLIAYLKKAEADPSILETMVEVPRGIIDDDSVQEIPPTKASEEGKAYSVEELLRFMAENSDNRATAALRKATGILGDAAFIELTSDLGMPQTEGGEYHVTPKQYSLLFRVLYNATYLSPEMSEKALAMLARSDFVDGLRKGVPADVAVAHKFGESGRLDGGKLASRELHDCGIVFAKKPYFLCVMTRGKAVAGLEKAIQSVSAAVYDSRGK